MKYYIYLMSPYGTELIGITDSYEKALEIKANKDKDWKIGDFWNTTIETKKLKEYSYYD